MEWKAVTVAWDDTTQLQLIFIINDFEAFYRNPVANGTYRYVDTDILQTNWIDRQDLLFIWEKRWFDTGNPIEGPELGSQQETYGVLKGLIQTLRNHAPANPYPLTAPMIVTTSSSSSSQSFMGTLTVTSTYRWRALTVEWVAGAPVQLIFIINNYESFFKDPVANGTYKYVDIDTLQNQWVDRQDLIFWWEKTWYDDGSTSEAPVFGSHKEIFGSLIYLNDVLRSSAP